MYAIQGNMKMLSLWQGKQARQAHEKEKKYKVDNNIKPICLSKTVMVSFIYFLFQMVMMISAADWLSPPKSLL